MGYESPRSCVQGELPGAERLSVLNGHNYVRTKRAFAPKLILKRRAGIRKPGRLADRGKEVRHVG